VVDGLAGGVAGEIGVSPAVLAVRFALAGFVATVPGDGDSGGIVGVAILWVVEAGLGMASVAG
jgi:hypothetical protein